MNLFIYLISNQTEFKLRAFIFTLFFMQRNDHKQKLYKAKLTRLYNELLGAINYSSNQALIKTNQINHA